MGRLDKTLKLILRNPVRSENSCYLKLLEFCIEENAEKKGRLVHKCLLSNGFFSNLTLNTKLIIFYAKIGNMTYARKVFDKMSQKNIVSWTALLSGYGQNGLFKDALMVFETMHHLGVKGNQFTYGSILRSCTKLLCLNSGKKIQGCLQKSRFVGNLFVQSALVDLHSKCGDIEDASYVFQMMVKRDLVSWNAMVGGYSVQGFSDKSFELVQSMMREGVMPDCFTFGSLLHACTHGTHLPRVSQIHGIMVQLGYGLHDRSSRQLIDAYAKCGSTKLAYSVFRSMMVKDIMSYTAMIAGYAHENSHYHDALNLFSEVYRSGMGLDGFLLCTMVNVFANASSLNYGRQIHALALKCAPTNDLAMGNALIDMYAKCGELEEATQAFDQMQEKNVISWSSLIDAFAKHGNGHKAMTLFQMMENEGLKPNDVTFLSLLFACSHAGLTMEAWECFINMIDKYKIAPTEKHFSCMIDLFARGGQLEEALDLMNRMNIKPNTSLWGAILGASNVHGDVSMGKVAANHLFDLDIENAANYVAVGSVCAAAGLWNDSWMIHKLMEKKNIRKSTGCSLVLTRGREQK